MKKEQPGKIRFIGFCGKRQKCIIYYCKMKFAIFTI